MPDLTPAPLRFHASCSLRLTSGSARVGGRRRWDCSVDSTIIKLLAFGLSLQEVLLESSSTAYSV